VQVDVRKQEKDGRGDPFYEAERRSVREGWDIEFKEDVNTGAKEPVVLSYRQ